MADRSLAATAAGLLREVRARKPLVHNITNFVVMNNTANALLSAGASPVMAHAAEEVEEMVSLASALVLNIGTLTPTWIESMLKAGRRANQRGIPVVLDPVGSGATKLRTESAKRLACELALTVIRGNASEVLSLADAGTGARGVDAVHGVDDATGAALALAGKLKTTLAITGPVDLVTDGCRVLRVSNGHEMMGRVTGTGCTASALIGAFLSVADDPLVGTAAALAYLGVAGEVAASTARAPGSFQVALLDALYTIDETQLIRGARIRSDPV